MPSPVETLIARLDTAASCRSAVSVAGRVLRVIGQSIEVSGVPLGIGGLCEVHAGERPVPAEVVGFSGRSTFLMPLADVAGIAPGAVVTPAADRLVPDPESLRGRIIDAMGRALDGRACPPRTRARGGGHAVINPMERHPIDEPIDVGVRTINALLTLGIGQRIGLFAGSGVGKSVLLGMMSRFTAADVVVVALVGERGREVREFVDDNLGAQGLARSVVVATPADASPVLRRRAAFHATEIAEHFRARGARVLLLMDSLTRVAQAQREIGLAIGEPPATKGYPPSVFSLLPRLVERAGRLDAQTGAITAIYTVLAEGDDAQDPIVDCARSILDGHIVLSRRLADACHFPAIDVEASISRLMTRVASTAQTTDAGRFRHLWTRYGQQEDLISVGAYVEGSDPETDEAIRRRGDFASFLRQGAGERASMADSLNALSALFAEAPVRGD